MDKYHKPCPTCGNPMYRYSKRCFNCAGKKHRTDEERREYVRAKNRKSYQRNVEKRRAKNKQYYEQHKDELKEKQRTYRASEAEAINKKLKAKRSASPEHFKEIAQRYGQKRRGTQKHKDYVEDYVTKNKEAIRLQRREFRKQNRERINEQRRRFYQTERGKTLFMRMREKHSDSPLLRENKYRLLWIEYRPCQDCGAYERREVDHIQERSKGGTDNLSNLRVLCFKHHRAAGTGRHSFGEGK